MGNGTGGRGPSALAARMWAYGAVERKRSGAGNYGDDRSEAPWLHPNLGALPLSTATREDAATPRRKRQGLRRSDRCRARRSLRAHPPPPAATLTAARPYAA